LQYLSFESIEKMIYSMKALNLKKLQHEFLSLSQFHADRVTENIDKIDID